MAAEPTAEEIQRHTETLLAQLKPRDRGLYSHWTAEKVKRHNQTLLAQLEPGDLIEFPRGVYSHWAVYIGNEEVVHLSGDENDGINGQFDISHLFTISGARFDKALVKVDNFWSVVGGCLAKRNNSKDKKYPPLPKREIVRNALKSIGRVGYNVLFDNCEHFATWCRYGVKESEQVDVFLANLKAAGTGGRQMVSVLDRVLNARWNSSNEETP